MESFFPAAGCVCVDLGVLKDIQELLRDARSLRYQEIRRQHCDQVRRPEDVAMAVFWDSSHLNTDGILGMVAPPEFLDGDMDACVTNLVVFMETCVPDGWLQ